MSNSRYFTVLITFFILFIPGSVYSQNSGVIESEIIDIRGAIYGRLSLTLQWKQTQALPENLAPEIRKNLLWSGLFDLIEDQEQADLNMLFIDDKNALKVVVQTQEGLELFSSRVKLLDNPVAQEREVIRFVEEVTLNMTGQPGILGTAILYSEKSEAGSRELVISDTHAKKKTRLVADGAFNILPRWTPDADAFLFTSTSREGTIIKRYQFATKSVDIIARFKGISSGGTWGPDKKELIVTISNRGNADLYRINLKGKILRRLTRRSAIDTSPSWSPNGRDVLFVSDRAGSAQIYLMEIKNRDVFRMTFEGSYNTDPKWSKDGAYILYAGRVEGKFQIFLMDRNGEHVRQLTSDPNGSEQPDWSPDGRQIIYTSQVQGDQKVFIMTTDGKYKRRLTRTGPGVQEANPTWSGTFDWNRLKN